MGLFKSMKEMADLTKSAKQLQKQQLSEQGYSTGLGGQLAQMGDMISNAKEQLAELTDQSGDRERILAEGIAGEGVNKQYLVPAGAQLGQGVKLPIKVDPDDRAGIAIDWDRAVTGPAEGVVRQAGGTTQVAPAAHGPARGFASTAGSTGAGDSVAQLEKLAKLHDSGALTDAEFAQQKAKILGS